MIGFRRYYLMFTVLPLLWACADDRYSLESDATRNATDHGAFENILVRRDNLLFVNIGSSEDPRETRSASDESDLVSLESMLDRNGTETLVFKNYHIVQIPFRDIDYNQQASLSDTNRGSIEKGGVSVVRKFLVEISDTLAGTRRHIVATLVPTPENCMAYGSDSYSYIDKGTLKFPRKKIATEKLMAKRIGGMTILAEVEMAAPVAVAQMVEVRMVSERILIMNLILV